MAIARHLAERRNVSLAITDAATGELTGNVTMVSAGWSSGIAEAMYWLDARWRGRGFTAATLRLLCDWSFRALGLRRVELVIDRGNVASRRAAEAAGFRPDGTAPPREPGGLDLMRYALESGVT